MGLSAHALLLGLWGLLQALSVAGVIGYWRYLPAQALCEVAEGVVVIVPVKGPAPAIESYVAALLAQSAPLRAIFVVQSRDDPVWATLDALEARYPDRLQVIVAGLATDEGQKIHNLLAAIARLRADDRILVFLDADMLPGPHVVGRLLFPLVRGKAQITTGYRWLVPAVNAPATWLGAAINLQPATCPRLAGWHLPWGGAIALSRDTFERLDMAQVWRGALLDDLTLMRAARRQRVKIRTVVDLLLPSPGEATLRGLWRFGVRQYRHVFLNQRSFWMLAAAILGVQASGWAWALAAGGWRAVLIGYGAACLRAGFRVSIARRLPQAAQLHPILSVAADVAAPFLVCWVHLAMILVGGSSRRMSWGGVEYWMRRGKVEFMRRY
jgi:hypothetical protein